MSTQPQPNGEHESIPSLESAPPQAATCNTAPTDVPHSPLPTPHSATPASHRQHRHTGNVARLPKDLRDQLSQMILDGVPYKQIKARLGEHGASISINNISNWKTDGGLAEYVSEQDRLRDCRLRHELLERIATQDPGTHNYQASPKMAVAIIAEALIDLGPETLRKGLQQDPRNAYRLLNSLARLLSGGLKCEQFLLDAAQHKARLALESLPDSEKGLSPETTAHLIERLNLM